MRGAENVLVIFIFIAAEKKSDVGKEIKMNRKRGSFRKAITLVELFLECQNFWCSPRENGSVTHSSVMW